MSLAQKQGMCYSPEDSQKSRKLIVGSRTATLNRRSLWYFFEDTAGKIKS